MTDLRTQLQTTLGDGATHRAVRSQPKLVLGRHRTIAREDGHMTPHEKTLAAALLTVVVALLGARTLRALALP